MKQNLLSGEKVTCWYRLYSDKNMFVELKTTLGAVVKILKTCKTRMDKTESELIHFPIIPKKKLVRSERGEQEIQEIQSISNRNSQKILK